MTQLSRAGTPAIYFPGLNGIRAIAACSVMVMHAIHAWHRTHGTSSSVGGLDGQAVIMFFTLSGFLITYLLIEEKETCGAIAIKQFYMRRILRIWPLYFFYIAVTMAYHELFEPGGAVNAEYVLLFIFFLPNLAFNLGRYMPGTAPLWSIGIEEQFYAVWPWVVARVKSLRGFLLALIIGMFAARVLTHLITGSGKHLAKSIIDSLGYDAMATGALAAILFRAGWAPLIRIGRTVLPSILFVAVVVWHAYDDRGLLNLLSAPSTAVITALFIVSQISDSRQKLDLEQPVLGYLGKISFGIYVYHMLVITVVVRLNRLVTPDSVLPSWAFVTVTALATIAIASLSFRFLERPFLRFKDSIARVKTPGAT